METAGSLAEAGLGSGLLCELVWIVLELDDSDFGILREVRIMRTGRCLRFVRSAFVVFAMLVLAQAVFAHAILLESSPALNSKVSGPDVPIKLRFNVRIDKSRSRLTLVRPDGSSQSLSLGKESSADLLTSSATGLAPGEYRLRWQVLASDGHITRGEILFNVQGTETR